jgi:hypothetical protein
MAINTLSKNTIGVVLALLLVILLSESRLFKFLTDTYLGRAFLIIIILFASYLNKILGVACVLIIVIIFTKNSYSFYEGIDGTVTNNIDAKDKNTSVNNNENGVSNESSGTTTTAGNVPDDKINVLTSSSSNKKDESTTNSSSTNSTNSTTSTTSPSIEGFDLQATENTILRGKQSNTIPVNQYYNQSVEVAPYENSSFSKFFDFLHTMIQ